MKTDRRSFLYALAISGFSLYLPSCRDKKTKPPIEEKRQEPIDIKEEIEDPIIEEKVFTMEEALKSNNVIYLQKETEEYEKARNGFNLRVQKKPALIALCKNTEGISEAIKLAKGQGWKVAVKSGGHSFETFSSINDGLQINLSLMNAINWLDEETVSIEPACILKQLYDELLPKKRIIPAGSCGTVGVGGLTLGGGYGFFGRQYGLTCDSLIEATFVDGKGNIHQTKDGEELMWALKGGGNGNFGVVSQFKFKTHPAPNGFTRYRFKAFRLNKERTKSLLQKYFEHSAQLSNTCFAAFVLNSKTLTLLITNYGEMDEALQNMLDAFEEIMDQSSLGNKRELARSLRSYYGIQHPIYFKNASAGYYENYQTIESSIDGVLDILFRKSGLIFQVNTLGGNINSPEFEQNSCYPHRAMPYLSELQAYWDKGKPSEDLIARFQEIQTLLYNNGIRKQYRNYPSLEFKDWETAYYGGNYQKLQKIKMQYDPEDLFSNEQTVRGRE